MTLQHVETQTSPDTQYEWYYSVAFTMDEGEDTAQGFPLSVYCYNPPPDFSALHKKKARGASFDSLSILGMQGTMNIKSASGKEKSAIEMLQNLRMTC